MTTITNERTSAGWSLWLQWLIASTAGVVISGLLALSAMWSASEAVANALGETAGFMMLGAMLGTALGAGASIAQLVVVQAYVTRPAGWLLGSLIASLASGSLGGLLIQTAGWNAGVAIFGALLGLSVGVAQWLALRGQISRAGWWVVANGAGFALFFVVAAGLGGEGRELIALGAGGAVFGAVTGLALAGLLQRPSA